MLKALPQSKTEPELYEALGNDIAELLGLRFREGRYQTSAGTKSPEGLGRTVARLVNEWKERGIAC